ncbi:hypothetical protein Taro_032153 [Colocasia esculenta]|uniref:Uncharacterized protein n=1 Tax=Colocasia esculenta TaxID=4460 RepID=A0A843VQN7_COLES|nr:hypothetical protein [Colocasia esculenta]
MLRRVLVSGWDKFGPPAKQSRKLCSTRERAAAAISALPKFSTYTKARINSWAHAYSYLKRPHRHKILKQTICSAPNKSTGIFPLLPKSYFEPQKGAFILFQSDRMLRRVLVSGWDKFGPPAKQSRKLCSTGERVATAISGDVGFGACVSTWFWHVEVAPSVWRAPIEPRSASSSYQ